MEQTLITLTPLGGLANRMRAILAAWTLAQRTDAALRVVWLRDIGLNCRFDGLFRPLPRGIELTEGTDRDWMRYGVPRKRNAFLPKLYQSSHFGRTLFDKRLAKLAGRPERLEQLVRGRTVLIASGLGFYPADDALMGRFFVPTEELRQAVGERCRPFGRTVGLHIRRTDNRMATDGSPLPLFMAAMRRELEADASTTFYVASDSEKVKAELRREFPGRVLCSDRRADRSTAEGMREAVVELFALTRTARFYGSYHSSFSDIALVLHPRGGEILRSGGVSDPS